MPSPGLERRRRASARLALYGSLVVLIAVVFAFGLVLQRILRNPNRWAEQRLAERPEVELLRDYIRLPTTGGNEILGARFLAERLAEAGLEATVETLGEGRANLWAILEGEDPEALVLHHHIDVWDAGDPDEWIKPPFAAEIDGPWLYGRGAFDMKSYGIAQLEAFLDVAALEQPLKRSLILLATSDEESDSTLGTQWLLSQHPELVERFWAVLTEGGMVEALNPDDVKYWGIENAQLQVVPVRVCSPRRERLTAFVEDLTGWNARLMPLRITPELREFVASYGPTRAYPRWRNHISRPEFMLRNRWGYDYLPPLVQELFRDQAVVREIEEADGGGYAVRVSLLLLPGSDPETAAARLLPDWLTLGLSVTVGAPLGAAHGSPTDHPVFLAATDSLRRAYPQAPVGGVFLAATVTDSRYFRMVGVPSYGYSPFLFFTTDTWRVDRINERIPLPGFVSGVEIYADLVRRLVASDED